MLNPKNPRFSAYPRFFDQRPVFWITLLCLAGSLVASNGQATSASLLSATYPGLCGTWEQVNDNAFGMPSNFDSNGDPVEPPPERPYSAEEGFEVVVFDGQLYVGMEADNKFGARLWRTKHGVAIPHTQSDWEEVAADADGNPFGLPNPVQNDHIDSLAGFNGYLYASTANRSGNDLGTLLYRSPSGDPETWTQVNEPGFGDTNNDNFKDMQVFQGWLCGGTGNDDSGAEVWCSRDGTTWIRKNEDGFGDEDNVVIWSGFVFEDALYFGVNGSGGAAKLFRTRDLSGSPTWAQVYTGDAGSYRVDILGDLDGYLYISARSPDGIVIMRSESGDAGTWSQVNAAGMDGNADNFGAVVDSATVYNDALYVGVANVNTGFEVWRTTGNLQGGPLVDWTQVGGSGLGDPNNYYTELIPFNGYLYAWTSNYFTGQQVLRSKCPICQSRVIDGAGTYTFGDVGVEIVFDEEALDSVESCVYPGAFPEQPLSDWPVKRHFEINPLPMPATYTAQIVMSYTDAEVIAANAGTEGTTFLQRRTDSGWEPCPPAQRGRDVAANTVSCAGVAAFSPWAIALRCPNFDDTAEVTVGDLQVLANHWREQSAGGGAWDPQFDLDDNQRVDVIDFVTAGLALGDTCP